MRYGLRIMYSLVFVFLFTGPLWPQAVPGENSQTVGPQIAAASEQIRQPPRDASAYVTRSHYSLKVRPGGGKPPMKNAELASQDLETAIKVVSLNYAAQLTMRTPLIFLISAMPRLFNSTKR
jgi:hypothetical protein